jgi:hypothetical protein
MWSAIASAKQGEAQVWKKWVWKGKKISWVMISHLGQAKCRGYTSRLVHVCI